MQIQYTDSRPLLRSFNKKPDFYRFCRFGPPMIKACLENTLHVVGKTELKRWPSNTRLAWKIFSKVIDKFQIQHDLVTRAFVLMSNHYHWLCEYKGKDADLFNDFQTEINLRFSREVNLTNNLFKWNPQILRFESKCAYRNTYKYIYRNPVSAGLVVRAEHYPYSTLRYVLGERRKTFEVEDNMTVINDPHRIIRWINAPWGEQLYFRYFK